MSQHSQTQPRSEADRQAEFFRRADEAIRAEWDQYRDVRFRLEHDLTPDSALPSDTRTTDPRLLTNAQGTSKTACIHGAYGNHTSSQPLPRMRMVLSTNAYHPVPGKPYTYPPILSTTLEQCDRAALAHMAETKSSVGQKYQVIHQSAGPDTIYAARVHANFKSPQKVNAEVVKYFIENFWREGMQKPHFETTRFGLLRCEIDVAGSEIKHEVVYALAESTMENEAKATVSQMAQPSPAHDESDEYPSALCDALKQCNVNANCDNPGRYEVVEDTASNYMNDEYGVVATCSTRREANESAV